MSESSARPNCIDLRALEEAYRQAELEKLLPVTLDLRGWGIADKVSPVAAVPMAEALPAEINRWPRVERRRVAFPLHGLTIVLTLSALLIVNFWLIQKLEANKAQNVGAPPVVTAAATKPSAPAPAPAAAPAPPKPVDRLNIPKIGVNAQIVSLGLTKSGDLDSPTSLWTVGWYDSSSKPGAAGLSIIDGHSGIPGQYYGVFANLHRLSPGDTFSVNYADGHSVNFVVQSSQAYPANDATAQFFFSPTQTPTLRLISCYGSHDSQDNFSQRWIVDASVAP